MPKLTYCMGCEILGIALGLTWSPEGHLLNKMKNLDISIGLNLIREPSSLSNASAMLRRLCELYTDWRFCLNVIALTQMQPSEIMYFFPSYTKHFILADFRTPLSKNSLHFHSLEPILFCLHDPVCSFLFSFYKRDSTSCHESKAASIL